MDSVWVFGLKHGKEKYEFKVKTNGSNLQNIDAPENLPNDIRELIDLHIRQAHYYCFDEDNCVFEEIPTFSKEHMHFALSRICKSSDISLFIRLDDSLHPSCLKSKSSNSWPVSGIEILSIFKGRKKMPVATSEWDYSFGWQFKSDEGALKELLDCLFAKKFIMKTFGVTEYFVPSKHPSYIRFMTSILFKQHGLRLEASCHPRF